MNSAIVVHPNFDAIWPFAGDHFHALWKAQGPVEFHRLPIGDQRPLSHILTTPDAVDRLISLNTAITESCVAKLTNLREAAIFGADAAAAALSARGVTIYRARSEGFWGASVSEFALGLTIAALRRIPQTHREIIGDHAEWRYNPPGNRPGPGLRGQQFGDDARFANGTIAGKRVRIIGVGNIGSRFASVCHHLGADVAAWDPVAPDPCFHRSGARRVHRIEDLLGDAEVLAPMMPLRPETEDIVKAEHIRALPKGCLVVLVTRAAIVNVPELRRRVLADELSLAADVFDVEPLPLNDPLLGRHNVVHTPHNAGRTIHANQQFAEHFVHQFKAI